MIINLKNERIRKRLQQKTISATNIIPVHIERIQQLQSYFHGLVTHDQALCHTK